MTTALVGTITVNLDFLNTLATLTSGATASDRLNIGATALAMATGTGDFMASKMWYAAGSLTATTITYDLTALAGTYGTVTFTKLKALYIINSATVDGYTLSVGNAATPWSAPWSASTTVEKVMAGSPMLKSNLMGQTSNPWTVDGTHCLLKLDSGANTIPYFIACIGV